jgi:hypothetical protein
LRVSLVRVAGDDRIRLNKVLPHKDGERVIFPGADLPIGCLPALFEALKLAAEAVSHDTPNNAKAPTTCQGSGLSDALKDRMTINASTGIGDGAQARHRLGS